MSTQTLRPASATFRPSKSAASAPPRARSTPRVEILRSCAEVEAVAAEWRALERETPEATGFQSLDWCLAWMRGDSGSSARWRIVVVRDGGRIVSIWPLERHRFLGARIVRWLGDPWTQYGDALVAQDAHRIEHLAAAWREIAAWDDVDLVKLSRVRARAAMTALPGFNGATITHREEAPFIDFARAPVPTPDKRLRARRRKLEAVGPVRFDIVTDATDRQACVALAIAWKQAWLKSRGLASSGMFHQNLARLMEGLANSETLIVARLRVGDADAALELGLRANGNFRSLLGCHDERFSPGSPGHLLIAETVAWCAGQNFASYDLMVPADAYKYRWANDVEVVNDHLIATSLHGRCAAFWFRVRPALKQCYAKLPEPLRQRVTGVLRR